MSYVNRILQPGENLRYVSRLHWIIYVRGFLPVLIGVLVFTFLDTPWANGLAVVLATVGFVVLGLAWMRQWTTEIAVSDRRIIYKRGLISRHTIEMNLSKVESVDVDQSVLGRVLGYGTIRVRGTGAGIESLRQIDAPIEFRSSITAG